MIRLIVVIVISTVVCLIAPPESRAGTYGHVVLCEGDTGCFPATPDTQQPGCEPDCRLHASSKTHPLRYSGDAAALQIRICVAPGSEEMIGPTDRAIATWNNLVPATNNCQIPESVAPNGCVLWEDNLPPVGTFHAESVILHELGHCAMALGHTERHWRLDWPDGDFKETSFTASYGALKVEGAMEEGLDGIRGSSDDFHTSPTLGQPADAAGWFRKGLNQPWIVNDTVIDSDTYTRSVTSPTGLPPGHRWAANANRRVSALSLPPMEGQYDTQSVMYGRTVSDQQYSHLSADDINMVMNARAGKNFLVGGGDDYTVQLIRVASCQDPYDILVGKDVIPSGVAAQCQTTLVDYSYLPQHLLLPQHFTLKTAAPGVEPLFVLLNQDLTWDTDPPNVIFADGFESGTHPWSSVAPYGRASKI